MRPIRTEQQHDIVQDPWHGTERASQSQATLHSLSQDGSLDSQILRRQIAAGCGCLKPVGGYCAICADGSNVCIACFGQCGRCRKPLCPRHSVLPGFNADPTARLCVHCYEKLRRKLFLRRLLRVLFSPFVKFESNHGQP